MPDLIFFFKKIVLLKSLNSIVWEHRHLIKRLEKMQICLMKLTGWAKFIFYQITWLVYDFCYWPE